MSDSGFYNIPAKKVIYVDYMLEDGKPRTARAIDWVKSFLLTNDDCAIIQMKGLGVYVETRKDIIIKAGKHHNESVRESRIKRVVQNLSQ